MPIKILLADDHEMFREGIRAFLERDGRFEIVAEASNGPEMISLAKQHRPDVVLLDLAMPGRGGLEAAEELKAGNQDIKILVLTAHPEDDVAVRALKSGADGYLTKEKTSKELVTAILRIFQGGKYIGPELAETLALWVGSDDHRPAHEKLSNRELQVLIRLGSGLTATQIGKDLNLSVKTISTYRTRILEKLGMETTADLIRYALTSQLVE
jgi:DNA-binding NarL/FixJ family response regulator